jgi:hypothetical protein
MAPCKTTVSQKSQLQKIEIKAFLAYFLMKIGVFKKKKLYIDAN